MDPRVSLDILEKREISCLCQESNLRPSSLQPVCYSDCGNLAFCLFSLNNTHTLKIALEVCDESLQNFGTVVVSTVLKCCFFH